MKTITNKLQFAYADSNYFRFNLAFKAIVLAFAFFAFGSLSAFAGSNSDCSIGTASNIKYYVDGVLKTSGLRDNVKAGSTVKVKFTYSGTKAARFSLVSYTAPSAAFDANTAHLQKVYDFETRLVTAGTYTFEVKIPACYFQVDFVKGCIIEQLGPAGSNNFYTPQGRLIDADNGGGSKCPCKSANDVNVENPFNVGFPDTTVDHMATFTNTSTLIKDRINIRVQSSGNWMIQLRSANGSTLMATDSNGDGNWEYVNSANDYDADGNPNTKQLNSIETQELMLRVFIPADAEVGMLDTLDISGMSLTDHCGRDNAEAFTEVDEPFVLPVKLLYFNAKPASDHILLSWATATELNNDHFSVEHSRDGRNFEEFEEVAGAGNSNSKIEYAASDKLFSEPVMYYRLKQTDFDGTFTYSMVVSLKNKNASKGNIALDGDVFPNPFNQNFTVNIKADVQGDVVVNIIDIQGKLVDRAIVSVSPGQNQYTFENGSSLPKGMYFLTLENNGNVITSKIIKTADF